MPYEFDAIQKKVTVRGATEFPNELFTIAKDIEFLDLRHGSLSTLPDEFEKFSNLKVALFSNNNFTEIPEVLTRCVTLEIIAFVSCKLQTISPDTLPPNVRGLSLQDNQLRQLPASIGSLKHLQKLVLTNNQLDSLPEELAQCHNLEMIRLSSNRFTAIPAWLWDLPSLAWYTDTNNPCSPQPHGSLKTIDWDDVVVGDKIGESSRNTVHSGIYNNQPVAIKLYGHTSIGDGLPKDEINTAVTAGIHGNIIGAIGKLIGDDKEGLVMPLIPKNFTALGQPPSFTSLTRDVYPKDSYSLSFIRNCLHGIATALQHIHSNGVMHGDVYAHNIMTDDSGNGYIGDFGAASIYDQTTDRPQRERIDVRGFGYLIDDLLLKCSESSHVLANLRTSCLAPLPAERPTFSEIVALLASDIQDS